MVEGSKGQRPLELLSSYPSGDHPFYLEWQGLPLLKSILLSQYQEKLSFLIIITLQLSTRGLHC